MSNGMPLVFHAAFKPTPSIARTQKSVDLDTMLETELRITGRHDPCVVPRAVPVVEAAAAIAVLDALLEERKEHCAWN
jgi:chorismate synthase